MYRDSSSEAQARFEAMQAVAGSSFLAALLFAIASQYFLRPSVSFSAGSLFAGVLLFLAWHFAVKGKSLHTAAFVVLALVVSLGVIASELNRPFPAFVATGLSHLGVALFGLTAAATKFRRKNGAS